MASDVALARGLLDRDGSRHRRARLRAPGGQVELWLAERGGTLAGDDGDDLLAACLERIGGFRDPGPELVAMLTRGDRNRLALGARSAIFGDALLLVLRCPDPDCDALADLVLRGSELTDPVAAAQPAAVDVDTPAGRFSVRSPTGVDDAAAAGNDDVLWGLLLDSGGTGIGASGWRDLDPQTRQLLAVALSGLDPCADLAVVTACPRCGAWIEVELDPVDLLARSLAGSQDRLLAEVHCLAFHYGWAEDDILRLARPRRHAYLELIGNQVHGRPLLAAGA